MHIKGECAAGAFCREAHLIPIRRTHAVRGVRTHIVCGVGGEARQAARERSRIHAVNRVRISNCRVVVRTPAHTPGRHGRTTVGGDIAAAGGCKVRNIGNIICRDGRQSCKHNIPIAARYNLDNVAIAHNQTRHICHIPGSHGCGKGLEFVTDLEIRGDVALRNVCITGTIRIECHVLRKDHVLHSHQFALVGVIIGLQLRQGHHNRFNGGACHAGRPLICTLGNEFPHIMIHRVSSKNTSADHITGMVFSSCTINIYGGRCILNECFLPVFALVNNRKVTIDLEKFRGGCLRLEGGHIGHICWDRVSGSTHIAHTRAGDGDGLHRSGGIHGKRGCIKHRIGTGFRTIQRIIDTGTGCRCCEGHRLRLEIGARGRRDDRRYHTGVYRQVQRVGTRACSVGVFIHVCP